MVKAKKKKRKTSLFHLTYIALNVFTLRVSPQAINCVYIYYDTTYLNICIYFFFSQDCNMDLCVDVNVTFLEFEHDTQKLDMTSFSSL